MSFFEEPKEENLDHLRVYVDRSEYHKSIGGIEVFPEGSASTEARKRIAKIKGMFERGFLELVIAGIRNGKLQTEYEKISGVAKSSIDGLVESVTSEVGRALIGLSVMQLSIKSISPQQSVRLHKGGSGPGSFSWVEGVSMRTLDKNFVTPVLRKHELLRLNADGFMMTRSLAENYPYTKLYKAQLRGARFEWLSLVEELENGSTDPLESLKYLIAKLHNAAANFTDKANHLMNVIQEKVPDYGARSSVQKLMEKHTDSSNYAARLLEVSMHALMNAAVGSGAFGLLKLEPLSQMRSANKKHKNIGDIELIENGEIIESWDAKYGKGYLREEIEEATEKLTLHQEIQTVGFVTTVPIERTTEINQRIFEIQDLYGVNFYILTFSDWVNRVFEICTQDDFISEEALAKTWLRTYAEYLAQKRRDSAPIDEPCLDWVNSLTEYLGKNKFNLGSTTQISI